MTGDDRVGPDVRTGSGAPPPRSITILTRSATETRALGRALAAVARPGDRLALLGPLGAGKTQLAKGFAVGLGVDDVVNSPSFTLMAEYEGRIRLFHQDLYRLSGTGEALDGGLLDERQAEGVTLSEWADRVDPSLDEPRVTIRLDPVGETTRRIELGGPGDASGRYVAAAERFERSLRREGRSGSGGRAVA